MLANIGKLIKASRIKQGMSQAQLAERVGCTRRAVIYYETGMKTPSLHMADKLFSALGISLCIGKADELAGKEDQCES